MIVLICRNVRSLMSHVMRSPFTSLETKMLLERYLMHPIEVYDLKELEKKSVILYIVLIFN